VLSNSVTVYRADANGNVAQSARLAAGKFRAGRVLRFEDDTPSLPPDVMTKRHR